MTFLSKSLCSWGAAVVLAGSLSPGVDVGPRPFAPNQILRHLVIAGEPRLNRKVIGPVTRYVQGVAAEPVDSMVWDGDGSVEIEGELILEVDPVNEVGAIRATWTDEHGEWLYLQHRFIHPEHSSGVRIGAGVDEIESFINEGISHNVYLHGDTGAGMPVLPTVFNYIATWGPADVMLNGERFVNPFEIPAPQWIGHAMVTEGVRQPDGTVRTRSGEIYDPSRATEGAVETGDLEVHLVFHDERFPVTGNVPPLFSFFYHLVFEDVRIEIAPVGRTERGFEGGEWSDPPTGVNPRSDRGGRSIR